jgi:hypothetical protein
VKDGERVFVYILIFLIFLVFMPTACTMYHGKLVSEAIKNGTSPIDAKCALGVINIPKECNKLIAKNVEQK